jgi:death-on-curing protein
MNPPVWVSPQIIYAIHDEQLSVHGGGDGIRDIALIESALARPQNLWTREESVSIPRLAAAYCHGLVKNHGFVDGNKRVGAVACELFLNLSSYRLLVDDAELVQTILGIADGSISEEELGAWAEKCSAPLS